MVAYMITQVFFLVFVLVAIPCWLVFFVGKEHTSHPLNLPPGTVRSLLAMAVVGSFLITASIGPVFIDPDYFNMILSSLSALVGGVIGYYFGFKNSQK